MFTKKAFQFLLLLAVVLSTFAAAPAAYASSTCGNSVTVVSGDTLYKIATRCGTTVSALQLANPSIGSGSLIYAGQVLYMPGGIIYGTNGYDTYIVARGDTLKSLAIRFNTTVDALLRLNPSITNANIIYEGQRLTVPAAGTVVAGQSYTVQSGDTLRKIADKFGTTVDAILKVNPQITNANIIYVGQVITIPAGVTKYVVQRGDTLRIIAARFGTTVENLMVLNPEIKDPNVIYVGQVIRVW
jgi:peptidoglycan endopeptidase LytE